MPWQEPDRFFEMSDDDVERDYLLQQMRRLIGEAERSASRAVRFSLFLIAAEYQRLAALERPSAAGALSKP
jgi:hypothetical protein